VIWPDDLGEVKRVEEMLGKLKTHRFNDTSFSVFLRRCTSQEIYHGVLRTPMGKKKSVFKYYEYNIFLKKSRSYHAMKRDDKVRYDQMLEENYKKEVNWEVRTNIKLQIKFDSLVAGRRRL